MIYAVRVFRKQKYYIFEFWMTTFRKVEKRLFWKLKNIFFEF